MGDNTLLLSQLYLNIQLVGINILKGFQFIEEKCEMKSFHIQKKKLRSKLSLKFLDFSIFGKR